MVWVPGDPDAELQCIYLIDDGEAFLTVWTQQTGGWLILDIRMPGGSGQELHERLTAMKPAWPVIFVTSHGDASMAVSALMSGALDFIEKPCNHKDIRRPNEGCLALDRGQRKRSLYAAVVKRPMNLPMQPEKQVLNLIIAGRRCSLLVGRSVDDRLPGGCDLRPGIRHAQGRGDPQLGGGIGRYGSHRSATGGFVHGGAHPGGFC